ncbi:MAG TPA: succinate dehydrogenase, hydrophobic membrane anchor protein [Azospirillaceae bacterium]|nr:succinate dehydrogenase, hydrophobic membrane anchor protein [Azospirillaceae bacterium]
MAANQPDTGYRTALGRVRGLGSAKAGAEHWLSYRLLSAAYVPLTIWFVVSAIRLIGADHPTFTAWLAQPVNAVLMLVTVGVTFHHAAYGMIEVYEDYIHAKGPRLLAVAATKGACLLLALACGFAILKIALGA